jgi:hypothetical protein
VVLLQEAAFAFAREDDDDDEALPSIVQVAMDALEADAQNSLSTTSTTGSRQWSDLMAHDDDDDNDDAQKNALFAWGAEQIRSRLQNRNPELAKKISHDDAVDAIRCVSLNAFTVKPIVEQNDAGRKKGHASYWDNIQNEDFDLLHAVMQIGHEEVPLGNGLYLLASAANHSCTPNTHVTFDASNDRHHIITFRATEFIPSHQAITISYGPVAGVDGNFQGRRAELLASRTHTFVCQCVACVAEEARSPAAAAAAAINDDHDNVDDIEAMDFVESYIISGDLTAEEALLKSKYAPENIVQSRIFGNAMSDTSRQTIDYDVEMALGFQRLALKSLQLRCTPREDIAIAHEIVAMCLLHLFCGEKEEMEQEDSTLGNDIELARSILSRYFGEDYAYKQILDLSLASIVSTGMK